jgi:histidinol-phosphate aminotransferase
MTGAGPTDATPRALGFDPARHLKPVVRSLKAYTLPPRTAEVKIDQNENPYELPATVKRRVADAAMARPWGRYPEFDPRELIEALAAYAGWRADGVLVGNGSNELIEALLLVSVGPETPVVIPSPTFTLYAHLSSILGGRVIPVELGADLEYDAEAFRRARADAGAPVALVCSPNNPTGCVFPGEELRRLCSDSDGLVVVDEAYHEFSGQTAVPLLRDHPNLVVLRTFSKAMALAGLRVGYLMASPEIVREVNKARLPYNLNFFSQCAALAALDERGLLAASVVRLVESRTRLFAALQRIGGLRPYPSRANFLLVEIRSCSPQEVFRHLLRNGVLVRDVTSYPRLGRCLRISVGSEEENARLLRGLQDALATPSAGDVEAP